MSDDERKSIVGTDPRRQYVSLRDFRVRESGDMLYTNYSKCNACMPLFAEITASNLISV